MADGEGSPAPTLSTATVGDNITFRNVADLLQRISQAGSVRKKEEYVRKFFEHFRTAFKVVHGTLDSAKASNDSIFSVARILLPNEDKKRPPYGIRGPTLARLFTKVIGLDERSPDGRKLMEYKDPAHSSSVGDLGSIIYSILESRLSSKSGACGPSISNLHAILDRLACNNLRIQRSVLQEFIPKLSALEGKWLARIILKQLGLGLPRSLIFKCIHSSAQNLFAKTNSLEMVCRTCNDPDAVIDDEQVILFEPFHQMLCARLLVNYEENEEDPLRANDIFGNLPQFPFVTEIKYDGERFQLHYDVSRPEGDRFRWFSRSRIDYTSNFESTLTRRLIPLINSSCKSCIIDGEMMAWRHDDGGYTHKAHQVDVRHMEDDPLHRPCFVAFDVIYLNGEALVSKPLVDRMRLLRRIIDQEKGTFIVSEQKMIHSQEDLMRELNEAVANSQEGLIAKDLQSTYEIGKRSIQWLKIKPEYFSEHSVEDLDLVILGGYYTDSVRKLGIVNHFLVGLLDNSVPGKDVFIPVCRVGSGCLRHPELAQLVAELEPHFVRNENPNFGVIMKGVRRPQFFIDPKQSAVVTIKAMEILPNESQPLKYTLRFPRIIQIRRDKSWRDILTLNEFQEIQKAYGGSLARTNEQLGHARQPPKRLLTSPLPSHAKMLRTSPSPSAIAKLTRKEEKPTCPPRNQLSKYFTLPKAYKLQRRSREGTQPKSQVTPVKVIHNVFDSRVFCVIGSLDWKADTERLIVQSGGIIVQNPTSDMFAIIAENKSSKVETLIKGKKYDIFLRSWLDRCVERGKIVKVIPEDAMGFSTKTRSCLSEEFDTYGDSYTKALTFPETKDLLQKLMENSEDEDDSNNIEMKEEDCYQKNWEVLQAELEEKDVRRIRKFNFLQGCKIAFDHKSQWDEDKLFALKMQVKFYGGHVLHPGEAGVTHLITKRLMNGQKELDMLLLPLKWLEDCISSKIKVTEDVYRHNVEDQLSLAGKRDENPF